MVVCVALSRDGTIALTGSKDQTARLWDTASGKPIGPPLRHRGLVIGVAFSADGKTALTGSMDFTAKLGDHDGQPDRAAAPTSRFGQCRGAQRQR